MKILHIIPSLDYCGAAAQLGLLSKHLPHTQEMHICCLGGENTWAERLRQHGRTVDCLNWTRVFDPTPPWKLHRLLKDWRPEVIHAWGPPALRALGLVGRRWLPRTLVSRPLSARAEQVKPFDRWLLRRVHTVVASSHAEAALCRDAGVPDDRLAAAPPGVETGPADPKQHRALRSILCIGTLEPHKGVRDAIWAFDMLHYVYGDTCLKIVGDGPQRAELERFAANLEITASVEFLGRRDDVSQMLRDAIVCWIPTRKGTGSQVALEAMAAGCPVVARERPGMRELIADGQTGYVVPPGDMVAVAKRSRGLLLDDQLRQSIGAAARRDVAQRFAATTVAEDWAKRYAAAA
jgi:glycosyltransferase involved in cell wall biosynthesis